MKKKYWVVLISLLTILFCQFNIEAKDGLIKDIGTVKSYNIYPTSSKMYLSRDGSLARPIEGKQTISLPGTYFLTTINQEGNIDIITFTIPYTALASTFRIRTTDKLDELFKGVLQTYKDEVTIYFENGRYTRDELVQLIDEKLEKLVDTYPKLHYEQYSMTVYGQLHPKVTLKFKYALEDKAIKSQYDTKIHEKAKEIIEEVITSKMTDYEREWAIASYLIENITYGTQKNDKEYMVWGGLIDKIAVCDGYAKSFMYLLNSVGVPTLYIDGTGEGMPHAWNLVHIGDGYYHVDLTWADEENSQIGTYYNYINETDYYMSLSHTWDKDKYPKVDNYSLLSMYPPNDLQGVYKINSKSEWDKLKKEMVKDPYKEHNIIFYQLEKNRWSLDKLLKEIVELEKTPIYYSSYYKYNGLILNYGVKNE